MIRYPFHLYHPEAISGSEDKRPNITNALVAQGIPRVLGAVYEPGTCG